jgi:hypothetical protein
VHSVPTLRFFPLALRERAGVREAATEHSRWRCRIDSTFSRREKEKEKHPHPDGVIYALHP